MRSLLLISFSLVLAGCVVRVASPRDHRVAPAAALLRVDAVHHGVLDGGSTMSEWVCLEAERGGRAALVLELEDPDAEGALFLRDRTGAALQSIGFGGGRPITELFVTVDERRLSRCVELRPQAGLTMYKLRWRYR